MNQNAKIWKELIHSEQVLEEPYQTAILTGQARLNIGSNDAAVRSLFSRNIAVLRLALGFCMNGEPLRQGEFANLVSVAPPTVNKWENCMAIPNKSVILRIVEIANASLGIQPELTPARLLYKNLIPYFFRFSGAISYERRGQKHSSIALISCMNDGVIVDGNTAATELFPHSLFTEKSIHSIPWLQPFQQEPGTKKNGSFFSFNELLQSSSRALVGFIRNDGKTMWVECRSAVMEHIVELHFVDVSALYIHYLAFLQQNERSSFRLADAAIEREQLRLRLFDSTEESSALQQEIKRLRSMIESSMDGLMLLSKDFAVERCNTIASLLAGRSKNNMQSIYFQDIVLINSHNILLADLEKSLSVKGLFESDPLHAKEIDAWFICTVRRVSDDPQGTYAATFRRILPYAIET